MYSRLFAAVALSCLPFLGGCFSLQSGYDGTGRSPPRIRPYNGTRIAKECLWFYAAIQDTIFGIDYYVDMEEEFSGSPYE
jgi:hypothetical protein